MRQRLILALIVIIIMIFPIFAQETAEAITPGVYSGSITDEAASVRYSFEAVAGQEITITMEATEDSSLDSALSLFDPEGVLIQTDDDSAGNRNAEIVFIPESSGNFTIEASRYQFNPPLTTGDYTLTLAIIGANQGELDPLSIPPEFGVDFTEITLDETLQQSFIDENEVSQYFVIGAQQGDFIRVELTRGATLDATVRVLTRINQTLSVISRTSQNTSELEVVFATIPQTGWYLIEVERESGIGDYTLTPARISDTLLTTETATQAEFDAENNSLFFVFNATINERVFVNLTVTDGRNLEPELTIFDLNQNQLEQRSSTGAQVRATLNVPRSSPYIVQIKNLGTGTGSFELQLRRIPVDISKLPIRDAEYNRDYRGVINITGPIDYYRINGKAGELLTIEMVAIGNSNLLDSYLILADSNLNELIFNDNASASRTARITQFALPADGDYFILASRAGLGRGTTEGSYRLGITVGEIQLEQGLLSATLTWQGEADLNLFVGTPDGYNISPANPDVGGQGQLQIDSNTGCQTPTTQPIEHIYMDENDRLEAGDYTIWVWYQNDCMMSGDTEFTLTISYQNKNILTVTSTELERASLNLGERFEASIRITDNGANAFVVNGGEITTPSAQQTESQGGDALIVYGDTISGSITNEVFAHFYQFEGNEGDNIVITVERLTNNLDPIVVLRDALDVNLATNDDMNSDTLNSQITHTLAEDGRYIIAVTRYGVRDGTTIGNYTLTVNRVSASSE